MNPRHILFPAVLLSVILCTQTIVTAPLNRVSSSEEEQAIYRESVAAVARTEAAEKKGDEAEIARCRAESLAIYARRKASRDR